MLWKSYVKSSLGKATVRRDIIMQPQSFPAVFGAVISILLTLTACSTLLIDPDVPPVPDIQAAPDFYQPPMEEEYRIQTGDLLSIRSYYDPHLNQEVLVRRDGNISLLLLPDIQATGQTPKDLSKLLTDKYSKHIRDIDMTVSVAKSRELSVYVGGQVKVSSKQPLNEPLTVLQAVTSAGGFLPTANTNQVIVLRRQEDGQFFAYQIDMDKVLVNQARDIYLKRYDIVHVPMSPIGHVGKFVDQYINQIIPQALRFTVNYSWIETVDSDSPTQIQVVSP